MAALFLLVVGGPARAAGGTPSASAPVLALPGAKPSSGEKSVQPPTDAAAVSDFVAGLDDRQARDVLLRTLRERTPPAATSDRESLGEVFGEASRQLQDAGARLAELVAAGRGFGEAARITGLHLGFSGPGALDLALRLLAVAILALSCGSLATALLRRVWARRGGDQRLVAIGLRLAGYVAFTGVGAAAAIALSEVLAGEQQRLFLRLAVAFWAVRGLDLLARASLALFTARGFRGRRQPRTPFGFTGANATIAFGAVCLGVMREAGADHDVRLLIGLGLWTLLALCLGQGLRRLRGMLPGPAEAEPPSLQRWVHNSWFGLSTFAVALVWAGTLAIAIGAGIRALRAGALTDLVLLFSPALVHGVSDVLRAAMTRNGGREASDRIWATALVRCSRIVVLIGIALVLADIWDIVPVGLASDRLGEATVRATINVLFVVLGAYMVWELVKALVRGNAVSQERAEQEASDEIGAVQPASRMQTFLPLLEKFLLAVVVVVATLAAMKAIGVDTGPLLAGAGIAGIAIGFGAQTLVRDIVSGIFFLLDDAFRLGEYVEIDQTRGTVEGISIRSLRVRHHRGAIHTVPFGTIHRLTNYSRDWIILKLEFLLAFDTDLRKVKTIVKEIGQQMLEDPDYGQHFLEPVKSQGVRRMEQIGIVIGVKFMAKPGEQFILRREVYQRVRDAFEKNAIRFAQPQVVVTMPPAQGRDLTQGQSDAIAAAAAEVALPEEPPAAAAGGPAGRRKAGKGG